MPRHKRHRGGQPGNQNARKHGFYATNFTPEEIKKFCAAIKDDNQDPAYSALRVKVESALIHSPGNYRILREGSCLLTRHLASKNGLTGPANTLLKRAFRNILKAAITGDINLTNRVASESLKDAENLQNE